MSLPVEFLSGADDDLQVAFNRSEQVPRGLWRGIHDSRGRSSGACCGLSRNSSTLHGEGKTPGDATLSVRNFLPSLPQEDSRYGYSRPAPGSRANSESVARLNRLRVRPLGKG